MQHSGSTEVGCLNHAMGPPNALSLNCGPVTLAAEIPRTWWARVAELYKHLIPADGLELCKSQGDEELRGVLTF